MLLNIIVKFELVLEFGGYLESGPVLSDVFSWPKKSPAFDVGAQKIGFPGRSWSDFRSLFHLQASDHVSATWDCPYIIPKKLAGILSLPPSAEPTSSYELRQEQWRQQEAAVSASAISGPQPIQAPSNCNASAAAIP